MLRLRLPLERAGEEERDRLGDLYLALLERLLEGRRFLIDFEVDFERVLRVGALYVLVVERFVAEFPRYTGLEVVLDLPDRYTGLEVVPDLPDRYTGFRYDLGLCVLVFRPV